MIYAPPASHKKVYHRMTHRYRPHLNLGILGGGQLGRMLIAPALDLGIRLHFLDKEGSPCQESSPFFRKGSFRESQDILDFAKGLDALSIEIENVNTRVLAQLEEEKAMCVRPSASIIHLVQDKLRQKEFYRKHNFPTSEFLAMEIKSRGDSEPYLGFLPAVQKIRTSGYDGYGVKILRSEKDFASAFRAPSILERKVNIHKEISIILARDSKGTMAIYPPVEMLFHPIENILEYLLCPADIDPQIQKRAHELASDLAESLGLIGLLAVEMFLTSEGELLVNEMAPRPHNSGHHTIELCPVSQFEQCLRAIFDLPLGDTSCKGYGASLNLLGGLSYAKESYHILAEALKIPGVFLHLYGKKEARPFRKMGHITITADSAREVRKNMEHVQKTLRRVME